MDKISVGGLVSGLDTNTIINQLVEVERARVVRVERRQKTVESKMESFDQLKGKIGDLAAKSKNLSTSEAFNIYASSSSDEDVVTVSGQESAITGTYKVEVGQLATNLKVASKSFTSTVTALGYTGTLSVSRSAAAIKNDPTVTTSQIDVQSGDTLKDLANKINAAEGAGVKASLLNMGNDDVRLVLSAVDEGTVGFQIKDVGAANILDSAGLGIVDYKQKLQSDFNFRLKTMGPADTSTQFTDIFTGVGANAGVDAGDTVDISGRDAAGNAVNGTFTFAAGSTVADLLSQIKTTFESQGSLVDVSLNNSGEIVLLDQSGGVMDMQLSLSFSDVNNSGSTMQLTPTGKNGNLLSSFTHVLGEPRKAFYRLDGLSVASDKNKDDKTVLGTTFNLKKADIGREVEVSLTRDDEALKVKIQEFLDSFNMVLKFIDDKSKIKVEGEGDPNKRDQVVERGPFAGDSQVARIKSELKRLVTEPIRELGSKSAYTSISTIGVISNSNTGYLEIKEADFKKALENDFEGVRRLFINSGFSDNPQHSLGRFDKNTVTGTYSVDADNNTVDGVAGTRVNTVLSSTDGNSKGLMVEAPLGSGVGNFTFVRGVAGQLSKFWEDSTDRYVGNFFKAQEAMEKSIDNYKSEVLRMQDKVEAYRSRLTKQFTDLETAMSRLQSQSAAFQAQMSALR